MTKTKTSTQIIKQTVGTMASDVFYGTFSTTVKGKTEEIMVSNHLKDTEKEYEFRVASKCRAGFITMFDKKDTPHSIISGYKKNVLVNIQVKNENGFWLNVYTIKGGKWYGIDKGFLDVLTVGDMRSSFPDMCDMNIWNRMGAKTWADMAFVEN